MYVAIRFVAFVLVFIISFVIIKKSNSENKNRWIVGSLIVSILLWNISVYVPVEEAFLDFPSPETAFAYYFDGGIKMVVQGSESALVIAEENESRGGVAIVPKVGDSWRPDMGWGIIISATKDCDGRFVILYKHRFSEDYYIAVDNNTNKSIEISDNRNSKFESISGILGDTYYAHVQNFNSEYVLLLDGKEFTLSKTKEGFF